MASLMLMLDAPKERKEKLMISFVQLGIDLHGLTQCGRQWPGDGGHWMNASDPCALQRGKFRRPRDEGRTFDAFVDAMWAAYRPTAPEQEGASRNLKWVWRTNGQGGFVPNSSDGKAR